MISADFRDFLKTLNLTFEKFYAGKIDSRQTKALCVYSYNIGGRRNIAVGGLATTVTHKNSFEILIHWNENYSETERISKELYETLGNIQQHLYKNFNINYIELLDDAPIDLHTDDKGIYETLIRLTVYYDNI
jgi:hypothetical protein